jgi:FkbM family methyltransferase
VIPYTQPLPYRSQWGEDRWLAEHLILPEVGVFVDVGAGDGTRGSNTLYWEDRGWTGLCIDADPRNREPLARRSCVVSTCAVSTEASPRWFWMYGPRPSLSGLGVRGSDYTPITVECRPLCELLVEADIQLIDLLSIDVEGTELDVWNSFDPEAHRPGVVIIEYPQERFIDRICRSLGDEYELIHRTPSNLILRRDGGPPWIV